MTSKRKKSRLSETFHPKELYNLCDYDDFGRIRHWLNRNKDDNIQLKAALTYKDYEDFPRYNWTPLHLILAMGPPFDIIQVFIEYAPEVLEMTNRYGRLSIHVACQFGASLEIIQALVNSYPESVKVARYDDGWLPLHVACFHNVSLEVLNFLLESYPDGVEQKDSDGKTPLDVLKRKRYAMGKDNKGMLPLHHACKNGYSLHLIHFLIQAYTESTTVQDNDGITPLQYLEEAASGTDERGMSLFHREAAHFSGLNVKILPILFHANPDAIRLQDKMGLLPIHHATLNRASSLEALMLLIKFYPESIVV